MALPLMLGICLVSGAALYFTSKAAKATTNATSSYSPLSGDPEEMEFPRSDVLSPEALDSGPSAMIVEKATECTIPSPVAPEVVLAAEGSDSEATAADASATPVEVDPMAECNTPSTAADDVVNAAVVEGDSSAGRGCIVLEVAKADTIKVGGGSGRRAEVEPPGFWEAAKRALRWAKAKLRSGAEWVMLDPDVVRRILKRMIWVAVDSVVNEAFKGNTVVFKFCRILISELKCSL